MAKYLVETYYTCTFKVNHFLDDINESELKNLEQRDDGKFEELGEQLEDVAEAAAGKPRRGRKPSKGSKGAKKTTTRKKK